MIFDLHAANESSARYGRICRLVIEGGTKAVKEFVLQNLHPVRLDGLPATLRALKELFHKLKKDSILTSDQFEILYPRNNEPVDVDDIDLSLWVVLLRNATLVSDRIVRRHKVKLLNETSDSTTYIDIENGEKPIKNRNNNKFTTSLIEMNTIRSNVFKIKEARNYLFHKSKHEIDHDEFESLWWKVADAIIELKKSTPHMDNEKEIDIINKFKTNDLDQTSTANSVFLVQKQSLNELRILALKEVNRKRWTVAALLVHFVLVITTLVGVVAAIYIYVGRRELLMSGNHLPTTGSHSDDSNTNNKHNNNDVNSGRPGSTHRTTPKPLHCTSSITLVSYEPNGIELVKFLPRSGWVNDDKSSYNSPNTMVALPKYVIVAHTPILDECTTTRECCSDAKKLRDYDRKENYTDITYNGMVCESGVIIEGCGFDVMSGQSLVNSISNDKRKWREESIYFGFMGYFKKRLPSNIAIVAFKHFLSHLVMIGQLASDYVIHAECQVNSQRGTSPGLALYTDLKKWDRWEKTNSSYCNLI